MKKILYRIILLCTALALALCAVGCGRGNDAEQEPDVRLSVTATVFPYYDFARAVGGEYVKVRLLLPPGKDSHSFEPTAGDILDISRSDLFIYNGGEMEVWVDKILDALDTDDINVLKGMDHAELTEEPEGLIDYNTEPEASDAGEVSDAGEDTEYDEHVWTSPSNAILLVNAVCDAMCEIAPQYENEFRANAAAYIDEISEIDSELKALADSHQNTCLVFADRFPFIYFTQEYGFGYAAAFSGCAGDTEPSAATVAELIDIIREEDIEAVYHVEMSSSKTAQMISSETGVKVLLLNSCHTLTQEQLDAGVTYVELMRENIESLREGLEKKDAD